MEKLERKLTCKLCMRRCHMDNVVVNMKDMIFCSINCHEKYTRIDKYIYDVVISKETAHRHYCNKCRKKRKWKMLIFIENALGLRCINCFDIRNKTIQGISSLNPMSQLSPHNSFDFSGYSDYYSDTNPSFSETLLNFAEFDSDTDLLLDNN